MVKKLRIISSLILIAILLFMVLPISPILAKDTEVKTGKDKIVNVGDEAQVDAHTKVKLVSKNYSGINRWDYNYQAKITLLPQLTEDGNAIDTQWYEKKDNSGVVYYEAGNNLFQARATNNGRVSINDVTNRISAWTPIIMIGSTKLKATEDVKILNTDPLNENYHNNILQFTYAVKAGNILNSKTFKVERWIRIIEGQISELFVIDGNPNDTLLIDWVKQNESNANKKLSDAIAFDHSYKTVKVTNSKDGLWIDKSDFKNKDYPIIIDPTVSYTSSSYDGYVYNENATYNTAQGAISGTGLSTTSTSMSVGQLYAFNGSGYIYEVIRAGIYPDTSAIPDNANINSAYLTLYCLSDFSTTDFTLTVQNGQPSYPSSPMVVGDYNTSHYSGNGGTLSSSLISTGQNTLTLSSTGLSWINKTGTTKLMLRSSRDISATSPSGAEYDIFATSEYGTGYAPTLYVNYTVPVTTPTVSTSAYNEVGETVTTLVGYITDDGGEACSVRFQYGTTTSYGSYSNSLSGYIIGESFSIQITGLLRGTTYHFRSNATNSAGTGYGLDMTFITLPAPPTSFTVTAGNQQNVLAWTKGTGASGTLVMYKTSGYPSSITDGTSVYNSTGTGVTHSPLTQGITYYYSAWSYTGSSYSTTYITGYGTPYYIGAPTGETRAATSVATTTARLNGYLTATNQVGGTVTVSFEYGATVAYGSTAAAGTLGSAGSFYADIAGLSDAHTYHFRAKFIGANGTGYGSDLTFVTGSISAPTISTSAATGTGLTYSTLNGVTTTDGGATCTVWFKWGLSSNNLNQTTTTLTGLATGNTFYYNLTGLTPNTLYYFQAVGQNSAGIAYGSTANFTTTTASAPSIDTRDATNVGGNIATLNAIVTGDGGVDCQVQFEWDTDSGAPYANSTGWQTGKRVNSVVTALINGLTVGQVYYFRASILNDNSTTYGDEYSFTTVFVAPGNFTAKATGANTIALTWTLQGDQTYIVAKTTGYPVDRLDGTQVYFGTDTNFTDSDRLAGQTVFYRAWSWRSGDIWSSDYSEDAATTVAIKSNSEQTTSDVFSIPDEEYWNNPSIEKLANIPFFAPFNDLLKSLSGQPAPEMAWMFALVIIVLVIGLMIWWKTKSATFGIGLMLVGLIFLATIGILPVWFVIVSVIVCIGGRAFFQNKGGLGI